MTRHRTCVSYDTAFHLLQEGDILLIRPKNWYSKCVAKSICSVYAHIALVSRHNGLIERIEFGEIKGGITRNLAVLVKAHPNTIDVYRVSKIVTRYCYDPITNIVFTKDVETDYRAITNTMRQLTGMPYGWRRVWWMVKRNIPFCRLLYDYNAISDDTLQPLLYPVCSTAISYSFNKHGVDLVCNMNDNWCKPNDIAMSPLTHELFTLVWNPDTDTKYLVGT